MKGTMITAQRHDHIITRNQSYFKLLKQQTEIPLTTPESNESDDDEFHAQADPQYPAEQHGNAPQAIRRYPQRVQRQAPKRLLLEI